MGRSNNQYRWNDLQGIPEGFADGVDNDTVLSEGDVGNFVTNGLWIWQKERQSEVKDFRGGILSRKGKILRWDGLLGLFRTALKT